MHYLNENLYVYIRDRFDWGFHWLFFESFGSYGHGPGKKNYARLGCKRLHLIKHNTCTVCVAYAAH